MFINVNHCLLKSGAQQNLLHEGFALTGCDQNSQSVKEVTSKSLLPAGNGWPHRSLLPLPLSSSLFQKARTIRQKLRKRLV